MSQYIPETFDLAECYKPRFRSISDSMNRLDPGKVFHFESMLKMMGLIVTTTVLAYLSVVPRTLPPVEYNSEYKETLTRLLGSVLCPIIFLMSIFREADSNTNDVIDNIAFSFWFGYIMVILVEVILATAARLLILRYGSACYLLQVITFFIA